MQIHAENDFQANYLENKHYETQGIRKKDKDIFEGTNFA
jgi:hypothetical protein